MTRHALPAVQVASLAAATAGLYMLVGLAATLLVVGVVGAALSTLAEYRRVVS